MIEEISNILDNSWIEKLFAEKSTRRILTFLAMTSIGNKYSKTELIQKIDRSQASIYRGLKRLIELDLVKEDDGHISYNEDCDLAKGLRIVEFSIEKIILQHKIDKALRDPESKDNSN